MVDLLTGTRMEIGDPEWMAEVGWPLLFLIGLFVISLYVWSYLSRTFEKIKSSDSKYLDKEVAIYLDRMSKTLIISFLLLAIFYVAGLAWAKFDELIWQPILPYLIDLFIILFIILLAMLLGRILRHIALDRRMGASSDAEVEGASSKVSLLVLGYLIYIMAVIVSLIIIISLIPNFNLYNSAVAFLNDHGNVLISIIVMVLAIYFIIRLAEEVLEDFKYKTKKFNPQVIDLFKSTIRYILWTIAILTITYSLFAISNLPDIGLLLVILALVFILIGLAMSYGMVRNIFAGLALMGPNVYDINERVVIDGDLEGDIIQKNLMFTELRMLDGTYVNVPNSRLMDARIYNKTRSGKHSASVRIKVNFEIEHSEVRRLIMDAITKLEGLVKDPAVQIIAVGFDGNSIEYQIIIHAVDPEAAEMARSDLILNLQKEFHNSGREELI
ncbi:MAG TPA: mechanosensitive ion channel family protein [Methanomassiliicoccales archaeon]|nr:mechanosensitive ion channel family protein [Methanomassiliicoccales archaeon]